MLLERPLSFKRASARQTLYPYPDSPALGEQDRRSMSTTGGALPRRETYRSGVFTLHPQKTGEQLARTRDDDGSGDERDPAEIEAAYLNLVGGGGNRSRNISSELSFGMSGDKDGIDVQGYTIEESKKRTNYYEEQFQYKGNGLSSVRERIEKDSPVVAELRTNVIVKDEFSLVTDMSYNLSQRYSRPESSIMVNVEHSACLLLAGSFEPAYILTITALPSQLQPVTNKRNSALIQSFMADILAVPPERGILRFQPIAEENLAINGTTVYGEIERIEKSSIDTDVTAANAIKRAWTRGSRRSVHAKKPTVRNTDDVPSALPQTANTHLPTTSHSRQPSQNMSQSAVSLTSHPGPAFVAGATSPVLEEKPKSPEQTPTPIGTPNGEEKRKSTLNGILKNVSASPRPASSHTPALKPPPIPQNASPISPKVAKRKSFISIFKR
ncbi:hypothetical protein E4T42_03444 [Aureobasidium subglaciale]|uniref:L-dopachrome isomerase n=1 Tax=Aureobasidium subglaciale (strain EXF-2481) TaxID=1043005 RepID=A0A074YCP5_AURSE|nr:uncharacterized protein AUEXF2481DRAFT_41536 [Aureobasidium subglaciale EXF-2481]KAI5208892.1 hypothetical protein E4T38_02641 [Aureobasidium subglaciale]KAI5227607.1 hypothetical protein E4T40_02534 [Aureobasidium subglaciale]KAI5231088.1 hypothetical protein E4T41_02640 [Aureobasidium subglaciale]KAI5252359.1 hypothetical protein E4T42_03444 [Aureobasidium subglaciale]KAI5265199.1 hypothetical protein E4T46_02418 [Aureobasidium subglaciale]